MDTCDKKFTHKWIPSNVFIPSAGVWMALTMSKPGWEPSGDEVPGVKYSVYYLVRFLALRWSDKTIFFC